MMNLTEYRRTSARLADYLPWAALIGEGLVLNKDGSFQRTARFRGPDLDSSVASELVAVAGRFNNALRRLGSGWAIFVEAMRVPSKAYPEDRFPDPASALVDTERKAMFDEEGTHYESCSYLTFLYMPPVEEASRTAQFFFEGNETGSGAKPQEQLQGFVDRTSRILSLLDGFMPECAWLDDAETLTYLHATISIHRHKVGFPTFRSISMCCLPISRSPVGLLQGSETPTCVF